MAQILKMYIKRIDYSHNGKETPMNLKAFVFDMAKRTRKPSSDESKTKIKATAGTLSTGAGLSDSIDLSDTGFLDGMSSATARIVIERNLPANYGEVYDIKELQNQGRYYIAKIVEPPGKVVAQLLVDKLNGSVHFPKDKLVR